MPAQINSKTRTSKCVPGYSCVAQGNFILSKPFKSFRKTDCGNNKRSNAMKKIVTCRKRWILIIPDVTTPKSHFIVLLKAARKLYHAWYNILFCPILSYKNFRIALLKKRNATQRSGAIPQWLKKHCSETKNIYFTRKITIIYIKITERERLTEDENLN